MEDAIIVVQRVWKQRQLRKIEMWDRAIELIDESEDRWRYFSLTDARLDDEDGFEHRCVIYDKLARRWHLPELDD
eukprot:4791718-Prymnesium_polylepis.1